MNQISTAEDQLSPVEALIGVQNGVFQMRRYVDDKGRTVQVKLTTPIALPGQVFPDISNEVTEYHFTDSNSTHYGDYITKEVAGSIVGEYICKHSKVIE